MDFDNYLKTLEIDTDAVNDDTKPMLEKSLTVLNTIEKEKKQALEDLEHQKSESKVAFEKRNELKTKVRELESELEKDVNEELQNKYNNSQVEIKSMADATTELETELETARTSLKEIEDERRTEVIGRLPEESEERTFAETITDHKQLLNFVKISEQKKVNTDEGSTGKLKIDKDKKWDEYTFAEKTELKEKHLPQYTKLYYNRFGRNPA